jgi:hypothetical protein
MRSAAVAGWLTAGMGAAALVCSTGAGELDCLVLFRLAGWLMGLP